MSYFLEKKNSNSNELFLYIIIFPILIMLKITAYFHAKSYNYFRKAFKLSATEVFNNLFFISLSHKNANVNGTLRLAIYLSRSYRSVKAKSNRDENKRGPQVTHVHS